MKEGRVEGGRYGEGVGGAREEGEREGDGRGIRREGEREHLISTDCIVGNPF